MTGILADPKLIEYIGTGKDAPGVSVTGWLYGNFHQFELQIIGALFIIAYNVAGTYILIKLVSFVVPLRMSDQALQVGDDAIHGEEAYAIFGEGSRVPVVPIPPGQPIV
jgi:Amt family ammonium transporter